MSDHYMPPHLQELVDLITYKPGWLFMLEHQIEDDGSGGLALHIISKTADSFDFRISIRVDHAFLEHRPHSVHIAEAMYLAKQRSHPRKGRR